MSANAWAGVRRITLIGVFILITLFRGIQAASFTNGDFESGVTPWILAGGAAVTTYKSLYHGPTQYLWLGGAVNLKDSAYQDFDIPATATSATLSFFYNINSAEGNTMAYDTFYVTIRYPSSPN